MTNQQLFQAFAEQLGNTHRKFPYFKEFQGPLDYLKQYRKNLIQEFFDTLKTEAEMRLFVVPVDPTSDIMTLTGMASSPPSSEGNRSSNVSRENDDNKDRTSPADSNFTSRPSTNKDEDDSSKTYEPDLARRMVNQLDVSKNVLGKVAMPPRAGQPGLQRQRPNTGATNASRKSSSDAITDDKSKRKDAPEGERNPSSSIREPVSENDIFATADLIPTSKGYMTVEDWNSG